MPGADLYQPRSDSRWDSSAGEVQVAHPVVGVRPAHAVLGVLERLPGRARRSRRTGHSGHRTSAALLAVVALLASVLALSGTVDSTAGRREARSPSPSR